MKVLLDTSVISAYHDSRQPERMALTQESWKALKKHQIFVSKLTVKELEEITDGALKKNYLTLIQSYKILKTTPKIKFLAQAYVATKIIPKEYINDALLIATASVNNLDILISWNFKHMVNLRVKSKVNAINILYNLSPIEILTPGELL